MSTEHPILQNILSLAERATWQRSVDAADEAIAAWLGGLGRCDLARVFFVGCGTSLYAGQVGEYIVERVVHIPAEAIQAFAFATYAEPALLGPRTLVVGISASGRTEAVCDALALAREAGAPTLGITADADADIAQAADAVVPTGGGITVSIATRTYVQSLIALYLLALRLGQARGEVDAGLAARWRKQIDRAADGVGRFLDHQRAEIERLAQRYVGAANVFVLGSGPNAGTAEEAALKVIEMVKMYAEAQELENFLHGRLRQVDRSTPLFFIAPQGRASGRVLDFLTVTDRVGAPSVVLTDQVTPGVERLATHVVHMPVELDEFATPLLYIVPLHLFAYHMALQRGHDPAARRYPDIVPQKMRYCGDERSRSR